MTDNYTVRDLVGVFCAFVLLAPFLLAPGYLFGWLLDLLSFREQDLSNRLLLSLPFSIAFAPPILYLLGRFISFHAIWIFYGLCITAVLAVPRTAWRRPPLGAPSVWIVLSSLSLIDIQFHRRLYPNAVAFDYLFRAPVIAAIARSAALPPANPFYFPGHAVPFRYHYFWFVLTSLPTRLVSGIISPRQSLIAGTIWIGLALLAIVAIYLRSFQRRNDLRRIFPMAALMLCVSGLDLLPVGLLDSMHKGTFYPSVDWWNTDQLAGWMDSVLWTPHHIAALIACLIGFILLYTPRKCWRDMLAAAVAFAAAPGLSIFVAITFAIFLTVWTVYLLWKRELIAARAFASAGAMSLALSFPFLLELAAAGNPARGFLEFGVRVFKPVHVLHLSSEPFFNLLALPLNYFLEFGFFALIAIWKIRQPRSVTDAPTWIMLAVSLLLATFVRSHSIDFNDMGARSLLVGQFVLLIWAIEAFSTVRRQWLFHVTFLIGLATTGYELIRLRTVLLLNDLSPAFAQTWAVTDRHFGERNFQLRQTYEYLENRFPTTAIFQPNPEAYQEIYGGLYSSHPYALESIYFSDFGGDFRVFQDYCARLPVIFHPNSDPVPLCRELKLSVLIYKDSDPIWRDPHAWIWRRPPIYSNERSRAFSCAKLELP